MEKNQPIRTKWLTVRMTEEEYEEVEALSRKTTCRSLSEYARKTLMEKPVNIRYRNESIDAFVTGMTQLQRELKIIGTNFNQAVRRLHALKQVPDIQQWILMNEQDKTRLFGKIETISKNIEQTYRLWSRD